jgi:drug/metabolite transporter (DMT)-like permease
MPAFANPALFGAVLIVAGMAIIGLIDNFVRFIAEDAGLWQFHLIRSAIALPALVLLASLLGQSVLPRRFWRVAARCGVQALSMLLYFGSLPMMPMKQVAAALFTAPIWVLIFSALFFGHRIGPRRLVAVALGFAGVLVILRPDPANLALVTLMPLLAGALYGLSNLLTREWCATEPVGALLGGFFVAMGLAGAVALLLLDLHPPGPAAAEAAPFLTAGWRPVTAALLFWCAVQALGSLVAVAMLVRGYQSGETSYLAIFEYSFLITANFWAWTIWGETLDALAFAGMALIVASGVVIARVNTLPAHLGRAAE